MSIEAANSLQPRLDQKLELGGSRLGGRIELIVEYNRFRFADTPVSPAIEGCERKAHLVAAQTTHTGWCGAIGSAGWQ